MPWLIKPNLRRPRGRMVREAAYLQPIPLPSPSRPSTSTEIPAEIAMSSLTITPSYPTGSDTTDVFVGAIYIDTAGLSLRLRALLGSTKSGTAVTLKAKTTFSVSDAAVTNGTVSTSAGLANVAASDNFTSVQGYYYLYLSCASAECSWQCLSITLVQ